MKRDKYWGRELDEQGFKSAIVRFFHTGYQLRRRLILQVIARLEKLRAVIQKQSSYRFYSWFVFRYTWPIFIDSSFLFVSFFSSLLVVYEGYECCPKVKDPYNVDYRVIKGMILNLAGKHGVDFRGISFPPYLVLVSCSSLALNYFFFNSLKI